MARIDYSEDDDYYSQGFACEGVVSIWIGLLGDEVDSGADTLQDLCGVGYYRLDDQESNCFDFEIVGVDKLLVDLSYSKSFIANAIEAARKLGIFEARWLTAQYDFDYDPSKVSRPIASDPVFIGSFTYSKQA